MTIPKSEERREGCTSLRHHDTHWAYSKHGCRCFTARLDNHHYRRMGAAGDTGRVISAVGATRRARALAALGYGARVQAEESGISEQTINALWAGKLTILAAKDALLRRAYDRLSGTLAPPSPGATRTRRLAAARGWAFPLAWDDDTIGDPDVKPDFGDPAASVADWLLVERALRGEPVELARADKHAAVHEGLRRGIGRTRLILLLRIGMTTVRLLEAEPLQEAAEVAA